MTWPSSVTTGKHNTGRYILKLRTESSATMGKHNTTQIHTQTTHRISSATMDKHTRCRYVLKLHIESSATMGKYIQCRHAPTTHRIPSTTMNKHNTMQLLSKITHRISLATMDKHTADTNSQLQRKYLRQQWTNNTKQPLTQITHRNLWQQWTNTTQYSYELKLHTEKKYLQIQHCPSSTPWGTNPPSPDWLRNYWRWIWPLSQSPKWVSNFF